MTDNQRTRVPVDRRADHPLDGLQETCIKRMIELGMTPAEVGQACKPFAVDGDHVCRWLERRSAMTTHKAQWVLQALGLRIVPEEGDK